MKELKQYFEGRGEEKGYIFWQLERTKHGYLYKVTHSDTKKPHYEVFRRRENNRFGVVSYPKSNAFGLWAWTYPTLEMARQKLAEITPPQNTENLHHVSGVLALEIKM